MPGWLAGWMDGSCRPTRRAELSHRPGLHWDPPELSELWAISYNPLLLSCAVEHTFPTVGIKQCQPANTHAGALAKHNKCCLETKEPLMETPANLLNKPLVWWQKLHM